MEVFGSGLFGQIRLFRAVWTSWENESHDTKAGMMGFTKWCIKCCTYLIHAVRKLFVLAGNVADHLNVDELFI